MELQQESWKKMNMVSKGEEMFSELGFSKCKQTSPPAWGNLLPAHGLEEGRGEMGSRGLPRDEAPIPCLLIPPGGYHYRASPSSWTWTLPVLRKNLNFQGNQTKSNFYREIEFHKLNLPSPA